ncbi:MAG TPA: ABC transporter permease [Bryobacteraceae bacterium]|nr:ABC transporter permease [Bryobacteraceae bacterium]
MSERRDSSLLQLTLVRIREFLREPEAIFWTFGFPILLAAGLGIAFRNKPADIVNVAVLAGRPETAQVMNWLRADKGLHAVAMAEDKANLALRTGGVALVVVPKDGGAVTWRYDDTNPDGRAARLLVENAVERGAGRKDPVPTSEDRDREPGSRYIDFLLPGLLGMNMMGDGMWGIGFGVVDARRRKLLKRLIASPMSRAEYLFSHLLARIVVLATEMVVIAGFGRLVFGVPFRGPLVVFMLICAVSGFTFVALGLLLASRVQTIEAISGLMNLAMLPMWVVSGVFFSSSRFPDVLQPAIHALPLTAAIDALRINMLQGGGVSAISLPLATLGCWLAISFVAALRIFKWR